MTTKQSVLMGLMLTNDERALFSEYPDEPGFSRTVRISMPDFVDMGSPEVITVTIEPGDLLNDDAS